MRCERARDDGKTSSQDDDDASDVYDERKEAGEGEGRNEREQC